MGSIAPLQGYCAASWDSTDRQILRQSSWDRGPNWGPRNQGNPSRRRIQEMICTIISLFHIVTTHWDSSWRHENLYNEFHSSNGDQSGWFRPWWLLTVFRSKQSTSTLLLAAATAKWLNFLTAVSYHRTWHKRCARSMLTRFIIGTEKYVPRYNR